MSVIACKTWKSILLITYKIMQTRRMQLDFVFLVSQIFGNVWLTLLDIEKNIKNNACLIWPFNSTEAPELKERIRHAVRRNRIGLQLPPLRQLCPRTTGMGTYWFWCVGVAVGVGVRISCLHTILWPSGWILTNVSGMHYWDKPKK